MSRAVQLAGIIAMSLLATAILALIAHTFDGMISKVTPDGKVPVVDAGMFTALLLSFREVIGVIKSIWEHADRSDLTTALSNSSPISSPNPPANDGEQA
ncbi:hypothetical protein HNO88_001568 [Novosphingobium chloroacetimidivorans]|uniref:Uncharacterized protein n=1 Tax=Novosphingobium chloroacetimidivorans TaxID=1428314 RepID=A0A7W7K9L6_9SPHN|nr:hypothetical protein [Novosphingobium chloroacetimidivorans]MBB4858249.1 hypothetical protein [Novosphingobium chloroacetimidivorans]